jgi:regulator of sigma E protease
MRVETFSIGFPPRAFGKKIGDTDYCISWIPIGGYVKISGMIDESFDTEFLNQPPQPYEFRSKPLWQRVLVISGGVIMNVLLAIIIFWGIVYYQGKDIRPVTEIGYVRPESAAEKVGFRINDKVLTINGEAVKEWDEIEGIIYTIGFSKELNISVRRGDSLCTVFIPRGGVTDITEQRFGIFPYGLIAVVGTVEKGKPAETIGLQPGDVITTVNGDSVQYGELPFVIRKKANKTILLGWTRDGKPFTASVRPTDEGRLGISLDFLYKGPIQHVDYSFIGALPVGAQAAWQTSIMFAQSIYQIVSGKVSFSKSVGGPIKIAQLATRTAESGVLSFLGFVGLLSMSLALLNILPFPALDGGHLAVLLIEAVIRREIPVKVKIAVQQVGFFLLLAFMAFVIYNDIRTF